MAAVITFSDAQLSRAVGAIRSYDAVVVAGAGMSAYGFPMTRELPALVWRAIDAVPDALATLRATAGRDDGSAKEILHADPDRLGDAWSLLRAHRPARDSFQSAFAQLDADREPSTAHLNLARLIRAGHVECVISFNWDTCLERSYQRAYGISLPDGVLFKPHGDAARPSDEWVLPDEAGVVSEDVLARIEQLSDRPRTLLVVGYSGSDEAVVEQLLDPLDSRWPVVRIGPSAIGDGALPAGADVALAEIVRRLGDAPLRGWRYVTFDRSRDFSAALRGERLRPTDVDACPELPAAARLAGRLANSRYATVSGPSGSGKSITAFHAARRLNTAGWAVVELTRGADASHADIREFLAIGGPVLAVVDDAQALPPALLDEFRDAATNDHAVLLVSTVRLEDRDDETLMAAQAKEVVLGYCLQNLDIVAPLICVLDDRVRKASLAFETPKQRLQLAGRTSKEPWLFMFIASGGDRRIGGALDRIVDSPAMMAVFAGICIGQMLSRDDGISRADLERWVAQREPSVFTDPTNARALVDNAMAALTLERLASERAGKFRTAHVRIADRALHALGLRGENGTNDKVLGWIREALLDETVPPSGKLWLFRTFDRSEAYRVGPMRQMVDSEVIEAVVRQLKATPAGRERGAGLVLVWSIDFVSKMGDKLALRVATLMAKWIIDLGDLEVNGFRWMASGLRSSYPETSEFLKKSISGASLSALLSERGTRQRASDWSDLIQELTPKWDDPTRHQWVADFTSGLDTEALSSWLSDLEPDSQPWEVYELISALAEIAPGAAQAALRACGPNMVQAFEMDLADAGSNFSSWVFGIMHTVASLADADGAIDSATDYEEDEDVTPLTPAQELAWASLKERLRPLAATTLAIFEEVDWKRSAQSLATKEAYELESLELVLGWLGALSSQILDRIAAALPRGWLFELSAPDEPCGQRQFLTVGRLLYFLSESPGGQSVAREFLQEHELELDPFPSILIHRFPDIAVRCHARGQALECESHGAFWEQLRLSLDALVQEDRATAITYLGDHREMIRDGFAIPYQGSLGGVRAFISVADSIEGALFGSIVRDLTVHEVETAWRNLHAAAAEQLLPLLELAVREEIAATPLARELLADSDGARDDPTSATTES